MIYIMSNMINMISKDDHVICDLILTKIFKSDPTILQLKTNWYINDKSASIQNLTYISNINVKNGHKIDNFCKLTTFFN